MEKVEGPQRHLNPKIQAKPGQAGEAQGHTPAPHSAADSHPKVVSRANLSSCSAARVSSPP